jgi:hypothetical protein
MKRLFTVICLFIWMPIPAMGGWFGPSNYEECILKNMKGVASDKAVLEIRRACRAKFPKKAIKKPKLRDVPKEVLEDITGDAWFEDKAHTDAPRSFNFFARLRNNNAKWTITEVKIRIFDKATKKYEYILSHKSSDGIRWVVIAGTKEWEELLPPLGAEVFPFFVKKVPAKWEWDIVGAKGYRKPFLFFF